MDYEVKVLGRRLGHCLDEIEHTGEKATTFLAFRPAAGVPLPELCDLKVDYDDGWALVIRGEGGGEITHDLVGLLSAVPRIL